MFDKCFPRAEVSMGPYAPPLLTHPGGYIYIYTYIYIYIFDVYIYLHIPYAKFIFYCYHLFLLMYLFITLYVTNVSLLCVGWGTSLQQHSQAAP